MIEKQIYKDKVLEIKKILEKYDFFQENLKEVQDLEELINGYAFRVVLIGGFSSGKSALLNRLIGEELFKEDQGPETAVPAEVSYADKASAAIFYDDGKISPASVDGLTAAPPQNASFLSIHVNAPFLKQRPELVLVDFPGFDSKIEAHNKAIANYLQRGSAFILLVQAQSGTLTDSDRKFVREAMQYPQGFACFVSQSDLVPEENLSEIVSNIKKILTNLYGEELYVDSISTKSDIDENFENKLSTVIDKFDPNVLFKTTITSPINLCIDNCINVLKKYIDASKLDVHDIDLEIKKSKEKQLNLERELNKKCRDLDREYKYEIIPNIMNRLENTLRINVDQLANAALAGGTSFADSVQSLLRPVLNSVPGLIQTNLRSMVGTIQIQSGQDSEDDNNLKKALLSIVDVISALPGKDASDSIRRGAPAASAISAKALASGVGTGVLAGVAINPIVGVIVGLAPTLIELFFSAKAARQPDPYAQAKSQVEMQIPRILERLESQVESAVLETKDMMIAEIQERINENIAAEINALDSAQQKKKEREAEHEQHLNKVQEDINFLQTLYVC